MFLSKKRKKKFNAHECVGELRGKKKKIKYGSLIDKINEKKRKESNNKKKHSKINK